MTHLTPTTYETHGSTGMNTLHEALARAQCRERLERAALDQRAQRHLRARRMARRAERAALRARLALARAL